MVMAVTQKTTNARRHLRFPPDPEWGASLHVDARRVPALIINESHSGCQLVVNATGCEFGASTQCTVRLGTMAPVRATLRWVSRADDLVRLGIEYQL